MPHHALVVYISCMLMCCAAYIIVPRRRERHHVSLMMLGRVTPGERPRRRGLLDLLEVPSVLLALQARLGRREPQGARGGPGGRAHEDGRGVASVRDPPSRTIRLHAAARVLVERGVLLGSRRGCGRSGCLCLGRFLDMHDTAKVPPP